MVNNAPGGCGNDLAIDDITFSACNPVVSTGFISSVAQQGIFFCVGTDTSITSNSTTSTGYGNLQYQWQTSNDSGKTWLDIPYATDTTFKQIYPATLASGIYLSRLAVAEQPNITDSACRVFSGNDSVAIKPVPVPVVNSNTPLCSGQSLIITAAGGAFYRWAGPGKFSAFGQPVIVTPAMVANSGQYAVTAISAFGCTAYDSLQITVNPSPKAIAGANVSICEGTSTQLVGAGGGAYSWLPVTGLTNSEIANPVATPGDTTTYTLTVTNDYYCSDSASVTVSILKSPVADAGPERQMTQGQTIELKGSAAGYNISYYWTPNENINDAQLITPSVSPLENITYSLHVLSQSGCGSALSDVFVLVYKKVEVPNAFSPNGDGINDTWNIVALQTYALAEVTVFNRYGQMVYRSEGYNTPWDGTYNGHALPIGTYYYVIDLKNGTPLKSGNVTILR
jgi:gliding motility-associated-like protein